MILELRLFGCQSGQPYDQHVRRFLADCKVTMQSLSPLTLADPHFVCFQLFVCCPVFTFVLPFPFPRCVAFLLSLLFLLF